MSAVAYIVYHGADVLVPERTRIGPLLQQVFGPDYNSRSGIGGRNPRSQRIEQAAVDCHTSAGIRNALGVS